MSQQSGGAAFHEHLDACARCRNDPFGLCATGEALLRAAVVNGPVAAQHMIPGSIDYGPQRKALP